MKKNYKRETKNGNEYENKKIFLQKIRKRCKKEDYYLDYIGEKSILINQKAILIQVDYLT